MNGLTLSKDPNIIRLMSDCYGVGLTMIPHYGYEYKNDELAYYVKQSMKPNCTFVGICRIVGIASTESIGIGINYIIKLTDEDAANWCNDKGMNYTILSEMSLKPYNFTECIQYRENRNKEIAEYRNKQQQQ